MSLNDPLVLKEAQRDGYGKRLLKVLERDEVHPRLLATVLHALTGVIKTTKSDEMLRDITIGLRGVTWLLGFLDGPGYRHMCIIDEALIGGEPVPHVLLNDLDIIEAMIAVIRLIAAYCERGQSNSIAEAVVQKLDNAGREKYLFKCMECPDDNLLMAITDCLNVVPIDNLEPDELDFLCNKLQNIENINIGRTEEFIGGILMLFKRLAHDKSVAGQSFRDNQVDIIHVVLDLLIRNTKRDTRHNRQENDQKVELSQRCVEFLSACTQREWPAALSLMMTRNAVEALSEFFTAEEHFGLDTDQIYIERTGLGRGVKALLYALPNLSNGGIIAQRVLCRIAEVLEGVEDPTKIAEGVGEGRLGGVVDLSKEDDYTRKWRVSQHAIFLEAGGIDKVLHFLSKDKDFDIDSFAPEGLREDFQKEVHELENFTKARLMGDHIKNNLEMDVRVKDGIMALINESLHRPELVAFDEETIGSILGDDAEEDHRVTTAITNAATVAASLRVFCALLMYGSTSTSASAANAARNPRFIQTLVSLADRITDGKWYPGGVGTSLLRIFNFLFKLDEVRNVEQDDIIPLYDVAAQVFRKMLAIIDPAIKRVLNEWTLSPKRKDITKLPADEAEMFAELASTMATIMISLQYLRPTDLDEDINEEVQDSLAMRIINLEMLHSIMLYMYYDQIVTTTNWQEPVTADAEFRRQTRQHITEFICEYLHVNDVYRFDILQFFNRMEVKRGLTMRNSYIGHMLYTVSTRTYLHKFERYLLAQKYTADGNFERIHLCRWKVVDMHRPTFLDRQLMSLGLIESPEDERERIERATAKAASKAFSTETAKASGGDSSKSTSGGANESIDANAGAAADQVGTSFIQSSIRRLGLVSKIEEEYMDREKSLGVPNPQVRLVAVSNAALYICIPPKHTPCNLCDASEFCPSGPIPQYRMSFANIKRLVLHPTNQRLRIWYRYTEENSLRWSDRVITMQSLEYDVLDEFAALIVKLHPNRNSLYPVIIEEDTYTMNILKSNTLTARSTSILDEVKDAVDEAEGATGAKGNQGPKTEDIKGAIIAYYSDSLSTPDKHVPHMHRPEDERLIVTTPVAIYIIKENINWWLCDHHEDNYLQPEKSLTLESLETVRFLAEFTPTVQLVFTDPVSGRGDNMTLTFACDSGREMFRLFIKQSVSIENFMRDYQDGDAAADEDAIKNDEMAIM